MKQAYVTMGNKPVYLAHCLVLAASIRDVGDDRDIVVLVFDADEHAKTFLNTHKCAVDSLKIDVRYVSNPIELARVSPPYGKYARRYAFDYVKLLAFTLREYDAVLFMDGDMVVNGPLDEVFSTPPPKHIADGVSWIAAADGPYSPLNSGLVLIKPNLDDYRALVEMVYIGDYREPGGWEGTGGVHHGSSHTQGMYPHFFRGRVARLPRSVYNNQVPADLPAGGYDDIRVVHFTGHGKPRVQGVPGGDGGPTPNDVSRRAHARWHDLWEKISA